MCVFEIVYLRLCVYACSGAVMLCKRVQVCVHARMRGRACAGVCVSKRVCGRVFGGGYAKLMLLSGAAFPQTKWFTLLL